jgi:hypothetical protein
MQEGLCLVTCTFSDATLSGALRFQVLHFQVRNISAMMLLATPLNIRQQGEEIVCEKNCLLVGMILLDSRRELCLVSQGWHDCA